jgi:SNF2 family DNA or RNA helicase
LCVFLILNRQTRPTTVVRLIVKDSIEEKLFKVQQRKRDNVTLSTAKATDEVGCCCCVTAS